MLFSVFFFQAEDGIRDLYVTGVQTCALPISIEQHGRDAAVPGFGDVVGALVQKTWGGVKPADGYGQARSEERRVGKECRSRWSPYHEKKKRSGERNGLARTDQGVETDARHVT